VVDDVLRERYDVAVTLEASDPTKAGSELESILNSKNDPSKFLPLNPMDAFLNVFCIDNDEPLGRVQELALFRLCGVYGTLG